MVDGKGSRRGREVDCDLTGRTLSGCVCGRVGVEEGKLVTGLWSDVTVCWLWKQPDAFLCRFWKEKAAIDCQQMSKATQSIFLHKLAAAVVLQQRMQHLINVKFELYVF